jgi:addiction module RelB/DinJ family antitoxin
MVYLGHVYTNNANINANNAKYGVNDTKNSAIGVKTGLKIVSEEVLIMAQATFSVRMDENLKRQFDVLCADFGMNATTAFNIFARAVVRERKIPFEIRASEEVTRASGMQAFFTLRSEAEKNGIQDLSLDEINEEIQQTKRGTS